MKTRLIILTLTIASVLFVPQLAEASSNIRSSLNHKWRQIQERQENHDKRFKALEHEADHLKLDTHSITEHLRMYHSDNSSRHRSKDR